MKNQRTIRIIAILINLFFMTLAQSFSQNSPSVEDDNWYINKEFKFKIKKIPGWEINYNEKKDITMKDATVFRINFTNMFALYESREGIKTAKDASVLGLNFTRPGKNKNTSGPLMITVKKLSEMFSDGMRMMQGELLFPIYADGVIDVTKNFEKSYLTKETLSINNLTVRQARWEWFDRKDGNRKISSILMIFEPVKIGSDFIKIQVIFKDNSEDYEAYRAQLEDTLQSISVIDW